MLRRISLISLAGLSLQEEYAAGRLSSRVFVLTADKGIGKSSIAAMLTKEEYLAGYFFCFHDSDKVVGLICYFVSI